MTYGRCILLTFVRKVQAQGKVQWDHPQELIIGDLHARVSTRSMSNSLAVIAHSLFVASFEPKDIGHVLSDPSWINAMHEELENFEHNQVWFLVDLPQNCHPTSTKWIFKNKLGENGLVVRNKAHLVL